MQKFVKILLAQEIPCFVRLEDCDCRVCYPDQPSHCSTCRESVLWLSSRLCRSCHHPGHMVRKCTQAEGPSISVSSPASDGSSDESDHATEKSSPSPCPVAFVPISAQSAPGAVPTAGDSDHVMEELPRSSPKAPAVSDPVSVPAQSVTVPAAPATVTPTVSASPVTVPVSATMSAAPVTVTGPAIVTTSAPATVTASSTIVTASVPTTVTVSVPTTSSSTVPASQVSAAPCPASSDREFAKFFW